MLEFFIKYVYMIYFNCSEDLLEKMENQRVISLRLLPKVFYHS